MKARLSNTNQLKALITVPEYSFARGRSEIAATGEGNSHCFWRIENPELQQVQTVQFGVVVKVPIGTASIDLNGLVAAEPSIDWLAANVRNVLEDIDTRLRALLSRDGAQAGKDRLPIGAHETWTLVLPK
ncbi:MAG: hypothetical protein JOZ81_16430 [Chloroflexi bacterium]|nr:hypothetical protein [Chloroflexota bacterium]